MTLRHAVLAALLDGERSGYELAKEFDARMANFWYARPQQLYTELSGLERDGLVTGRQVVQEMRPNKRLFTVTEAGIGELHRFAAATVRPSFPRDDLLVKVQAVDRLPAVPVIAQLTERARIAAGRAEIFDRLLERLRDGLDEAAFLASGTRIGPYLACQRGLTFEHETRAWCERTAAVLRDRETAALRDREAAARTADDRHQDGGTPGGMAAARPVP
ncbi:PadR family transcriptional regulator [Streptomyces sp. BBFR2]|uniref:PadR family transcriptional regulator n=1 Tax=Streptomyces sp. BBFR2 TaxID=3372854 RepID=UPI0037DA020A